MNKDIIYKEYNMSKINQEKIKAAVDLVIDKETDLTSFFAKDGMLRELTKNIFG